LLQINRPIHFDKKIPLLIFILCFTVFVFSNDGHRYTFDEDAAYQQSYRIATFEDDPSYIQGESKIFFEYPWLFPPEHNHRAICQNGILCSGAFIFHSVTQVPFILTNHIFNFISDDDVIWTIEDFDDFHYLNWRNNMNPDFIFLELFYGPLFTALSVSVLFKICRSYGISSKNSIFVSFMYAFTTMAWGYSQTSLSSPPMIFFALSGFYYYKIWNKNNSPRYLIFSGISFGFAFLTRSDAVLFIVPLFFLILYLLKSRKAKIKSLLGFIIPTFSAYGIHHLIWNIRNGFSSVGSHAYNTIDSVSAGVNSNPVLMNIFGMFFSPGVGLFVFSPILVSVFVGFFDFYKKHKTDSFLFLGFISTFLYTFGTGEYWHGLNGWGPRYLLPIIPFFLIPIAFSLEKRGTVFKLLLIILGGLGFFINLVYLLQDTHWFVWGFMGDDNRGLYSLARKEDGGVFPIWINPLVIWSFEYNQITQSVMWFFSKLQVDLFLLKLLGIHTYIIAFLSLLAIPAYLLLKNIFSIKKLEKSS
jgi:hypothetical protein